MLRQGSAANQTDDNSNVVAAHLNEGSQAERREQEFFQKNFALDFSVVRL